MASAVTLIILLILFLLWPRIIRWLRPFLQRWMMRRMENYVRKATGMPPRDSRRRSDDRRDSRRRRDWQRAERWTPEHPGRVIPPEYAEDVEFTESIEYSSDRIETDKRHNGRNGGFKSESQVSDVEWEDIDR